CLKQQLAGLLRGRRQMALEPGEHEGVVPLRQTGDLAEYPLQRLLRRGGQLIRYSPEVVNYGILLRTTRVRSSRCGAALRKSKTSRITDSRIALALCRACRSRLCLNRSRPNCLPSGFQDSVIPSV